MTTGGKSIELIIDHLLGCLGPLLHLTAVGPELRLRIEVVSSVVESKSNLLSSACKAMRDFGGGWHRNWNTACCWHRNHR